MSTPETSRFVRLRVDLVLEVTDAAELTGAAIDQIDNDASLRDDERGGARAAVREDRAEALAYLVDPFDLVHGVSGVDLVQASWSSEQVDYDPDAAEWNLDGDDDEDDEYHADSADEDAGERTGDGLRA